MTRGLLTSQKARVGEVMWWNRKKILDAKKVFFQIEVTGFTTTANGTKVTLVMNTLNHSPDKDILAEIAESSVTLALHDKFTLILTSNQEFDLALV